MAYKCRICGVNDVSAPGEVCDLCAIGQDPYASAMQQSSHQGQDRPVRRIQTAEPEDDSYAPGRKPNRRILVNGGGQLTTTDPYGNSIVPQQEEDPVSVYQPGQTPVIPQGGHDLSGTGQAGAGTAGTKAVKRTGPLTSGITKNISVDDTRTSALRKLFRALFKGIPFALDDEITMFQVFPDYTGNALTAAGNACDQVIVYGKLKAGTVSENNEVEVYGKRDSDNNIIASKIINKASGTTVTPDRTIPVPVIWGITAVVIIGITALAAALGATGIVWALVLILCLTNLPLVFKILGFIFGLLFSFMRRS